jgi:hypothetical protein
MATARKKTAGKTPGTNENESRHGRIADGNMRRQLMASRETFARWDEAAARDGLLFSEWARRALDVAARVSVRPMTNRRSGLT